MRNRVALLTCVALLAFTAVLPAVAAASYTLKEGDTLFSISRKSGVPAEVLTLYNEIKDASRLKIGTVVRIPSTYTVKKGDTLFGIAKALSIPRARIMDLNKLDQDSLIKAGQVLYVPDGAAGTATAAVTSNPRGTTAAGTTSTTATTNNAATPSAGERTASVLPPMDVVWPHSGKRASEKGKLWWLVFQGASGDVVHSATAGEVKWASTWWGYGKVVIIKAADGTTLMYRGNRELLVKVGDRVQPGTEIARLGDSLQGGGTKLYVSINDANGKIVDPEKFFSAKSQS